VAGLAKLDLAAAAYAALGSTEKAAQAAAASGLAGVPAGAQLESGGYWVNAGEGFRFASPRITEPAPGIQPAQGYGFGDFAFVSTGEGVVAIDAGTAAHRAAAALAAAGLDASQVSHVILTHSHFGHAGGVAALLGPGTEVIAQVGFPAELERQQADFLPFRNFTGSSARPGGGEAGRPPAITADRLVNERVTVTIGGTELVLYPVAGGETGDALMIYLPASGVLFTGDVMMPCLGAPFFAEGSPGGLLESMEFITGLRPRTLVHGHTVLTEMRTSCRTRSGSSSTPKWRGRKSA
jgi:glyoxylase-like metal-dependent hydrolase (beta-lactamase superfamily II)